MSLTLCYCFANVYDVITVITIIQTFQHPCFKIIKREVLDNFYIIGGVACGIAAIQVSSVFEIVCYRCTYKAVGMLVCSPFSFMLL